MHGYHTIHALAYEIEKQVDETNDSKYGDYEKMFEKEDDDLPLMVFHYGMTLGKVKEILNTRKIVLKNNEFIEVSSIKF